MSKDSAGVLSVVFSRLYILRNQIIHGWNSRLNRSQMSDANRLLMELLPIIKIMIDNPKEYWSPVRYPVQK